jgi:hypothetical protein
MAIYDLNDIARLREMIDFFLFFNTFGFLPLFGCGSKQGSRGFCFSPSFALDDQCFPGVTPWFYTDCIDEPGRRPLWSGSWF